MTGRTSAATTADNSGGCILSHAHHDLSINHAPVLNECMFVGSPKTMRVGNMSTIDALLADAAQLPVADRLELIDALWDTLPDEALPPLSDEWMAEIRRRSAELSAGTATTIPWEVVRGEALVRLSKAPQSNRGERRRKLSFSLARGRTSTSRSIGTLREANPLRNASLKRHKPLLIVPHSIRRGLPIWTMFFGRHA